MRDNTGWDREFRNRRYDEDDEGTFEPNLVFVAMAFAPEMNEVYSAIKDECKKQRLKAARVDENVGSGLIIREITELIERAEFIIFDLTCERPNVYYELGYAHGTGNDGNDIFLIANETATIHFDVAPLRIERYSSTEQLRGLISTKFKQMVKADRRRFGRT
jgi:hypothetical protein